VFALEASWVRRRELNWHARLERPEPELEEKQSRRTSCMSLYPRGGLRKGVYPLQWEKTLASTNYSRGSLHIRRWSRTVRWNENAHPNGWHAIVPGHVIGGPATTISDRCHHSLGRLICYSYIFVLYLCINRLRINEHVNKCNGHMSPFGA
jgi:hypothetical protein